MNAFIHPIVGMLRNTTGRVFLGAVLAGGGAVSTAQAHDGVDVHLDRHGVALEHRHWHPAIYEDRPASVWVEPAYNTLPGPRVWVEPVYRTVVDHIWREPVVQQNQTQVWVGPGYQDRQVEHHHHIRIERVFVPGHFETRIESVVVAPGHYEDVARQEAVSEGHWQSNDQQVPVTPGHYETRIQRVLVRDGLWEERPFIHIDGGIRR
ncbi:MAG TPA: hypothetical protein VFC46_05900 [Humisphaera sp.]|nr:hypothetical protein [Humisphaera sp.]